MKQRRAALAFVIALGLIGGVAAPAVLAGLSSGACAFADSETPTECVISSDWTIGAGGVVSNNFPAPGLPGPYAFHKDVHITNTGDIKALGTAGITLNIDAASGGTGALILDAGASVIDTSEDGAPPNDGAGPLTINAAGAGSLAAGSLIKSQNTSQGGNGGSIALTFGATSTFAGTISSRALTGTTSNNGGDITINVVGDLAMKSTATITSEKNADHGKSGDIWITVTGDMTMEGPGALITSNHPGASDGFPGGNIRIDVGTANAGTFTMQNGTRIDSGGAGFAGNVWIKAGEQIDINQGAKVLAGQRSEQTTRGHGGRIYVVAGCAVNIAGTLSSQGQDPGADLVHVEGCAVHVASTGLIESTGSGHQPTTPTSCDGIDDDNTTVPGAPAAGANQPGEVFRANHPDNSSFCVEIWARHVVIDAGGEINADFALSGGTEGHSWIDILAEQDVTIHGTAAGDYAVHSNSGLGNDIGGDVTVKAKKSFIALDGQALQANATANGGSGGHIVVQSAGALTFDGSLNEALGSQGTNAGHAEIGGTIEGRSFAAGLTGGPAGKLDTAAFDTNGSVILQSCTGTSYTGATAPGALSIQPNDCSQTMPTFAAYVVFNPGGTWDACGELRLSGLKFNDLNNNHDNDAEPGLPNWQIHVTGPNSFNTTVSTGANGAWTLVLPGPGTYTVCEVLQAGWSQTFPQAGLGTTGCAVGEGPVGYLVNTADYVGGCCDGADIIGLDFGNFQNPGVTCKEDPGRASQLTRTVNLSKPLGGGGVPGNPQNYYKVQDAYNAALSSLQTEVIGLFSKTTENLVLNGSKSLTITQCESAQVTALDKNLPVWKITSTGKLLIIGPDSVGGTIGWELTTPNHTLKSIRSNGASVAGVRVSSNGNDVSFNNISSSGIGLDILGNTNKFKSGTIGPNSGGGVHIGAGKTGNSVSGATIQDNGVYGVWIEGGTNTLESNKLYRNAVGIKVSGASNKVLSNQIETSTGDGINITGGSNTIQDNKVSKNGGDGIDIAGGSGNNLKSNASNNSGENTGFEFTRSVVVTNGGSNKADGSGIPSTSKCNTFFTGATATCE